jgi:hypothetical protein
VDPERHGIEAVSGRPRHSPPASERLPPPAIPEAVANRDLRGLAWWAAGALLSGALQGRDAAVVSNLIRTLQSLGPEPESEDDVLAEIELRGLLMNGFPPRTEEEWALAQRIFDAEALAEFHRWEELGRAW